MTTEREESVAKAICENDDWLTAKHTGWDDLNKGLKECYIEFARAAIAALDDQPTIIDQIAGWQRESFPDGTIFGAINHLQEEVEELHAAIRAGDTANATEELADVFLLTVAVASHMNCDLLGAAAAKLEVNRQRKWAKIGTYSKHVEETNER